MPAKQKKLDSLIAERIRKGGPITIAEYMELALGAYYGSKNPFGAKGDFITAPEISQMFGEMVGAWLVDLWMQMGRPEKVRLVELGPGRGTLAADIMRIIANWPDFKSAVSLHLVENSAALRAVQEKPLKQYNPEWHDSFSEVPEGICFVIANEFFDALPIHQFEKTEDGWQERRIAHDKKKDAFAYTVSPLDFDLAGMMPEAFLQAPVSSVFEISPVSLGVLEEISERVAKQGGAALIIDYGHAEPGLGDTLQAVAKHKYASPLENPGERDITAHVDFGTFKTVAERIVTVSGPVTQGKFLIELGIEARAHRLCEKADKKQRQRIITDLCRLVAPQQMGRLFKVMALTPKEAIINPTGFDEENNN
jgi:NADH dehydrogenase [ubiquinone] 1 alpha subcomplex assembly factor 7